MIARAFTLLTRTSENSIQGIPAVLRWYEFAEASRNVFVLAGTLRSQGPWGRYSIEIRET